jgi:hypothetical protein
LPLPVDGVDYPTVGIIDGGVTDSTSLNAWKVGGASLVPKSQRDEFHGTFIAGLVTAASVLNPTLSDLLENNGCKFFDLDLFPRRELRNDYYPDLEELFDILDEKVKVAKRDHNVRVFNLSFSIGHRSSRLAYSLSADRLDRIARDNDVIFVVAAGNLLPVTSRPPWPVRAEDALAMLAAYSVDDQHITAPSDHVLGITVGALNPSGIDGHVPLMPTTYTRRGPGIGGARKPDLAHVGGARVQGTNQTGLKSLSSHCEGVEDCGTSFAAPLTSTTLATLDHLLGGRASRETLLALPIHRAKRPGALESNPIKHIARDFVGFGIAPVTDVILNDAPHSVTLVFAEALLRKQKLDFSFVWPKSLVNEDGSCRGKADVTLCFTPPIDPDHREEAIRVQLEAHLHQEKLNKDTGELTWESRAEPDGGQLPSGTSRSESNLIKSGMKWSPVKRFHTLMTEGRGNTSNWKVSIDSLVRAGATFPTKGINFSLILTISDLEGKEPIREEMRLHLQSRGLILADITLAHQIRLQGQ